MVNDFSLFKSLKENEQLVIYEWISFSYFPKIVFRNLVITHSRDHHLRKIYSQNKKASF